MMIRNTTGGIHPYQQALYNKLNQGDSKQGQMTLYSAGRQTGKSMLNAYYGKLIYSNNFCKEITLTGQEYLQLVEMKIAFADLTTNRINQRKKVKQYNFSRANWYQAEFNSKDYNEVGTWCEQHFGTHPTNPDAWSRWWHKFHNSILFRDEKDYVLFMLRWS
jgi:hypothetical protein